MGVQGDGALTDVEVAKASNGGVFVPSDEADGADPNAADVASQAEREQYPPALKARMGKEMDEVHFMLSKFLDKPTLTHNKGGKALSKVRAFFASGRDDTRGANAFPPSPSLQAEYWEHKYEAGGKALDAQTPEDRLLRELKGTHEVVDEQLGKAAPTADYAPAERRPEGAAPHSLDPDRDGTFRNYLMYRDAQTVYEFYKTADKDTVYTTDENYDKKVDGLTGGKAVFRVLKSHIANSEPLTVFHNAAHGDTRLSTGWADEATGYTDQGPLGYGYTRLAPNTLPLVEMEDVGNKDHFYMVDMDKAKAKAADSLNIRMLRTVCYVLPVPLTDAELAAQAAEAMKGKLPLAEDVPTSLVYQYESKKLHDTFYTVDAELKYGVDEWVGGHAVFRAFPEQVVGTVPVYLLWNANALDHKLSFSVKEHEADGYKSDGPAFYAFHGPQANTVPLYEYHVARTSNTYYTTDPSVEQQDGAEYLGITAYVMPLSEADKIARNADAHVPVGELLFA